METGTRNVRLFEPGDQTRPAATPSRRSLTVSSFKHGHNGRRTKLTNGLLRAISDIIEDIEILSISHLNQELLARGHSLSRSTVFRAMEILGMRMDRDKKRWCIGSSGVSLGVGTRVSHLNESSNEGIEPTPPRESLDGKMVCETNERGVYIHSTGQLELIPSQYSHISSNFSISVGSTYQQKPRTSNHDDLLIPTGSVHSNHLGNSTATGGRDSTPVELSSATKRFKTVENLFPKYCGESDRSTKTSGLHQVIKEVSKTLVDDGQTPSTTDRQHTCQMCDNVLEPKRSVTTVLTRTLETGRSMSRKRKSDCPAKITPTSHAKSGTAKTPKESSTVYGKDFNPQRYRGHEQEYFSSTPQEGTLNFLPTSSGVPWLTNGSSQEATTKGTSGDGSNRRGRENLIETQTREVMAHCKLAVDGRGGTVQIPEETLTGPPAKQIKPRTFSYKPQLRRVIIQNHQTENQKNMTDEDALCKNGTTSDSQIPHKPESAKANQWSDQKPLEISIFESHQINTVEDNLSLNSDSASTNSILNGSVASGKNAISLKSKCRKLNQAPKMSQPRYSGHELSFPTTELSQIVIDTGSSDRVRGTIDEQGHNMTNVLQTGVGDNIKERGCNLRLQLTDIKHPMIRDQSVQHRPVSTERASRSLQTDGYSRTTPSGVSDPEGSSSLTKRPDTFYGTDSQTARLHALTSSLAVKTSNRMTSQSPRSESPKWEKDVESVAATRINCQHNPSKTSTAITPSRNTALNSSEMAGYEQRNLKKHVSLDADAAQSTQNTFPNISEIRLWMQDISQKMASMQQQLNYLTQVMTSRVTTELSSNGHINAMSPSTDYRTTDDLEEQHVDRFSEAGDEDELEEEEEEEEEQAEMQRWGRNLPPINTLESEDMISTLLSSARWESLSPFVGGPRLAIQLARDCIFGPEVLMRSTVTGRNGMNPLHRDGIKKIKDCMMEIYGTRCSHVEFELLWKMARESLSQLCKRIRRRHIEEINGQEVDSREVTGCDVESYEIIKPEIE